MTRSNIITCAVLAASAAQALAARGRTRSCSGIRGLTGPGAGIHKDGRHDRRGELLAQGVEPVVKRLNSLSLAEPSSGAHAVVNGLNSLSLAESPSGANGSGPLSAGSTGSRTVSPSHNDDTFGWSGTEFLDAFEASAPQF